MLKQGTGYNITSFGDRAGQAADGVFCCAPGWFRAVDRTKEGGDWEFFVLWWCCRSKSYVSEGGIGLWRLGHIRVTYVCEPR